MSRSTRVTPWLAALLLLAASAAGCSSDDTGTPAGGDAGASADSSKSCDPARDPTCQGAAAPAFSLEDFQPKSSRVGQSYGLDVFKGKVTVVALLAGS